MNTITAVKERPILFSTSMVQAILEGRKTVTRRIIKESFNGCLTNGGPHPCPNDPVVIYPGETFESPCHPGETITVDSPEVRAVFHCSTLDSVAKCRYGKPGDVLWVRETWQKSSNAECADAAGIGPVVGPYYIFKADYPCISKGWKPSIHMPRAACRLRLEIKSIRVESLHDITEEDAIREGIQKVSNHNQWFNYLHPKDAMPAQMWVRGARESFRTLWSKINGAESWQANPWVWVISFRKI